MWGHTRGSTYLSIIQTYVRIFDSHSFREDGQEIDLSTAASLVVDVRRVISVQVVLPYHSNVRSVISEEFLKSFLL